MRPGFLAGSHGVNKRTSEDSSLDKAKEDVEVVPKDLDTGCKFSQLVLHGQLQEVEGMLRASSAEASVELIEGTGYAFPALILAALASPVEMLQLLIDNGAKLDSRSRCAAEEQIPLGSTALHCAASQGRLEIVLALLEAGAWPNISDSQGVTPMMLVTRFEDPANHVAMTRALLDAGADPFSADVRGTMAFHVAAGRGSIEVVDMLLAKAPSTLNQTTANGATALYLAATEPGLEYMVSHLLSLGATNEHVLGNGSCPLTGAVHYALESMAKVILEEGWKAVGGPIALPRAIHLASAKDLPRTLLMLLGAEGADRRQFWSTYLYRDPFIYPLHRAIGSDSVGAVSVLLQAGAGNGVAVNKIFNKYNHEKRLIFLPRTPKRDQARKAAVRRTVARAAAFRARSWVLPVGVDAPAAAPAAAPVETAGKPVFVFGASRQSNASVGVRIYRPRRRVWFVGLIGRHSLKR